MKTNQFKTIAIACVCLVGLAAQGFAGVTTKLQPQSIALGDAARLTVTTSGRGAAAPQLPQVDGLRFTPAGSQSSMQIINGAVSSNISQIYRVTPQRVGSFTIPAIGGSAPLELTVSKGAARPQASSASPSDSGGESAFLRVVLPKEKLVVGELVPIEIKAYFRAGVSAALNGLPSLGSDAFALNKLGDEPTQTQEVIDGVPHTVVTWESSLSAVKAGEYALNMDLPIMLRVPAERRTRRDRFGGMFGGGSPFDDPFFQDFFGGLTEKPLTLQTEASNITIAALPNEGRPEGFTGAVGDFDVTTQLSEGKSNVGDPLTLTTKIVGKGNFSRVTTDGLAASDGWKTYDPGSSFHNIDNDLTLGVKVFEQSIVATDASVTEVPPVSFSYYDPEKQTYVTKSTDPIAVEIGAGTMPGLAAAPASTKASEPSADGLANTLAGSDHTAANLVPLVRTPWFLWLNGIVLGGLAIAGVARALRHRIASDPERLHQKAVEKDIQASLATMDAALQEKDTPRFFDAARHAVQGAAREGMGCARFECDHPRSY